MAMPMFNVEKKNFQTELFMDVFLTTAENKIYINTRQLNNTSIYYLHALVKLVSVEGIEILSFQVPQLTIELPSSAMHGCLNIEKYYQPSQIMTKCKNQLKTDY